MLDLVKLKELVALMKENDLTEVTLSDDSDSIHLKRGTLSTVVNHQPVIYNGGGPAIGAPAPMAMAAPAAMAPAPAPAAAPAPAPAAAVPAAPPAADPNLKSIDSPMVGTFYAAPNPDSPTFVKVGQNVSAGSVVCLIEAMKVFNEIKAEVSGTVERVLVKSGDPVEFGQKMFLVKAS